MKNTLLIASFSMFAFYACNSAENNSNNISGSNTIDPKSKGGNTCLLSFTEKYDELLTMDMVSQATGKDAGGMIFGYQKIAKSSKYHDVSFSWKTGRKKNVSGLEVPVDDYVKLTGIDAISLNKFKMSYKAVSAEDAQVLKNTANDAIDGKSNNKSVNDGLKQLDDMGISKDEQKKKMESLTNSAQSMTQGFVAIENLGDAAVWNTKTHTMYVFKNGAMFELVVDLSDVAKNKDIAIAISQMILDKCK